MEQPAWVIQILPWLEKESIMLQMLVLMTVLLLMLVRLDIIMKGINLIIAPPTAILLLPLQLIQNKPQYQVHHNQHQ